MPILGVIASSRLTAVPNSYESIASGGGATNAVTFSSIPSTYKHLQIRYMSRDDNPASGFNNLVIRFNGDSTTSYTDHYILANMTGTGTGGSGGYDRGYIGLSASVSALSNVVGVGVIDILDYRDTSKFKTVRSLHGMNQNTNTNTSDFRFRSNAWLKTDAITSITVFPDNSRTFTSVTEISLYGLKGA